MPSGSDVYVTFGGDTGALESASAAIRAQIQALAREMKTVAKEFNEAGRQAESELGKKLAVLGKEMAGAKSQLGELAGMAAKGGDAIKQMAERVGNAAYEYGPWTGAHVQLAQVIGEGLVRAASTASAAVTALGVAVGATALAFGASIAIVGAQVNSLRKLDDAARAAHVSMKALRDLGTAGAGVGLDADQLNQEMAGFAQKLREAQVAGGDLADFLKENNIAIKDAHGNLLPVQQIFGKIAELILSSNNEMDRLAALSKLGFSADTLRLIERQTDAVRAFAQSSISAQDDVMKRGMADGEALSAAWNSTWESIKGWSLSASVYVLGAIGEIEHQGAAKFDELANRAQAAFARISGDAKGMAAAVQRAFDAQRNEVMRQASMDVRDGKSPFGTLNQDAFGARPKPAASSDKPTIKSLYDSEDSGGGGGSNSASSLARETAQDEIAAAKSTFDAEKSLIDEKAKLHIISGHEQVAQTKRALDEEYAAEKAALDKEMQAEGLKPERKKAINNQILQLERQHQKEMQKLHFQEVEETLKSWDQMVDAMSGSLSSGISGMIEGTQTLRQGMIGVARAIEREFVKMGVNMLANWAKSMLAQVVMSQTAEGQKTAAAAAGAAARGGIMGGEAASGLAQIIASALKSIFVSASEAGAGAAAFMAPLIGPAAVAEGAAVKGAVIGMSAFDIGAWKIDQDQVAMVHRNELVMPAAEAGAFRSMLTGAANGDGSGRGGDNHHYNGNTTIHTTTQGAMAMAKSNPKDFAAAIGYLIRMGHLRVA